MSIRSSAESAPNKNTWKVILYTKPDCPDCFNAKRFFNNRDVPYETRDITDPQTVEELLQLLGPGQYTTPIIVLGEHVFVGFAANRRHIENVLDQIAQ
ncbi:MAG: glutaredoxin family protein [Anaerolineae bacterium]